MPVNLTQLAQNRASIDIDFTAGFGPDAGSLHVEWYPVRMTNKMLATYAAANAETLKRASMDEALAMLGSPVPTLLTLLASWDMVITAENGSEQPLPITEESLTNLGLQVQWLIYNGIFSEQSGQSSAAGKTDAADAPANAPSSAAS